MGDPACCSSTCSWLAKPKSRQARTAPLGAPLAEITAASAMKPWPALMLIWNVFRGPGADDKEGAARARRAAAHRQERGTGCG